MSLEILLFPCRRRGKHAFSRLTIFYRNSVSSHHLFVRDARYSVKIAQKIGVFYKLSVFVIFFTKTY